ncbi:MAG: hypothetical protein GTO46_16095 [Gemmatimonadetes bacterium]|nr:hypothetical protein [Gemmatimonadota bacterium]NIO33230.1 hypothetical protein [Gemmatimonadota bacterium]
MMHRIVPGLAVLFYLAMVFFVTYPGYVPFNQIRPFVFGLPFSLFWQVLWITSSIFVLTGVFLWERRHAERSAPSDGERE